MAGTANTGIYEIYNVLNGKRYIGSAVNFVQRWRQHRCELGKGRHNPILQNAWKKYGADAFEFRILEIVLDPKLLIEREQHHIDALKPQYNCARVAGSRLGVRHSAEARGRVGEASKKVWADPIHREKMSRVHRGQTFSPEHRAKISAAVRGRKLSPSHAAIVSTNNAKRNRSPEHRALVSTYWKGRPKTPTQIEKISESKRGCPAHNKGKPASDEQKAKQSATMKRKYEDPERRAKTSAATRAAMNTPEMRQKLRYVNVGRKQSAATIAKRAASNTGKKRTPEQRAAMSARTKAHYVQKRHTSSSE